MPIEAISGSKDKIPVWQCSVSDILGRYTRPTATALLENRLKALRDAAARRSQRCRSLVGQVVQYKKQRDMALKRVEELQVRIAAHEYRKVSRGF